MTVVMFLVTGAAVAFVGIQLRGNQHRMLAVGGARPAPIVHVGADETWRPAQEIAADTPPATAGHTDPDITEQTILADFDVLIDSWRTDPDWLTAWRADVDAFHTAHGVDTAAHHRWRWGAVDVPTGEYPLIKTMEGIA